MIQCIFMHDILLFVSTKVLSTVNIIVLSHTVSRLNTSQKLPVLSGHHVIVLRHHHRYHPVLQLLPAQLLDAISLGNSGRGGPAGSAL